MKDNKDFITSKFENENITAPDTLSEERIKARLDEGVSVNHIVKTKKNKKRVLKPLVSVAACIALVVGSFASVNAVHDARVDKAIAKHTENGVVYFQSYDELENFTGKLVADTPHFGDGLFYYKSSTMNAATMDEESAGDTVGAPTHSGTYTQVSDVDEADIIKTDGKYIYFLDMTDGTLIIYSAKDGEVELASKRFNNDGDFTYDEMYLDGDRLYLLGTDYSDDDSTVVTSLDISDRTDVKELDEYRQSGAYSTSRMIDGCIYVISNTYKYDKKFIPYCTNDEGQYRKIPVDDICAFECCRTPDYAVVGAIDTKSGKSRDKKVKAIMGGADNVYCTTENLYVSCYNYTYNESTTDIIKFELDGISLKQKAVGSVRGYVNNQWSFDEKDGYLRVATTTERNGEEVNKLYILDGDFNIVGDVGGYARGEHIEAVKYIGDMAYVITYETTDPLFCIDLSNPKDPKITGKVKITGFSTNLVPVDEDKLMGIGYSTENTEWGESRNGVKIVLFDVSDKNEPKVLDTKVYKEASSDAQYTHKAIVQNTDEGYIAIPLNYYKNSDDEEALINGAALVFSEKDGKIDIIGEYNSEYNQVDRVIYIGNYIYTADLFSDTLTSFELK